MPHDAGGIHSPHFFIALAAAGVSSVTAQGVISQLEGAPVDIHEGTCDDFLTEPAFDAGAIAPTSLADVWEDERLQSGLLVDEQLGASGVDLNDDGALQEGEVIAPAGEDATIGVAEAEFDEALDPAQPHVVVIHASADAYETIVACGAITTVPGEDEDPQAVRLQPTGDAALFGFFVLGDGGQSIVTYVFEPGQAPAASPAVATAPQGHPIDIHPGTCQDWTTEPTFDLGDMLETNVAAEGAQAPGDMSGEIPPEAEALGPVFKADAENEFEPDQLLNEGPFMVGVHESAEDYQTLIACGEVLPIFYEDQILVILKPVGDSNQTGMVTINQENGTSHAFMWNCAPLEQAPQATASPLPTQEPTPTPSPEPSPTPSPEPSPTPTVAPTPTQPATAVIEETEVVVETEVVPAETATAQAQQEGTPTPEE